MSEASAPTADVGTPEENGFDRRVPVLAPATFAVITGHYAFVGVLDSLATDLSVSVGLALVLAARSAGRRSPGALPD